MVDGNTRTSGTLKHTANICKIERVKWLFFLFLAYETLYRGDFSHSQGKFTYLSRLHGELLKKTVCGLKVSFNLLKKCFTQNPFSANVATWQ